MQKSAGRPCARLCHQTSTSELTTPQLAFLHGRLDHGREGVGLKRRAADERPVDILLRKEACHVVRLGRAAIQHAYAVCGRLPEDLGQRRPDGAADLLGVIGRRGLTGADGPDGLVGDQRRFVISETETLCFFRDGSTLFF